MGSQNHKHCKPPPAPSPINLWRDYVVVQIEFRFLKYRNIDIRKTREFRYIYLWVAYTLFLRDPTKTYSESHMCDVMLARV